MEDADSRQAFRVGKRNDPSLASLAQPRSLVDIRFVRNRMFYARPALNASGAVSFGLRHIRKCRKKDSKRSHN
jgi:hypothetical protein